MSAVNDKYKYLISYLEESSIAYLSDQEQEIYIDSHGHVDYCDFKEWGYITFKNKFDTLDALRQDFYDEITNNQHSLNFNENYYFNEAITEFNELLKKFTSINIGNLEVKIRTDLCVKYLNYFETDFSEDENEIGVGSPIEIVLAKDQYEKISILLLKQISAYFKFQEKYIKNVLNHLHKFYQPKCKRGYNEDYPFEYFMFNTSKIGKRRSKKDCINSFFAALIEVGYIGGPESLNHLTLYFNDKHPPSYSKVVWMAKGRLLYDIIKELNSRKYIFEAEGSISNIIIKIFVKEDGTDFTPAELYSRHSSKKMTQEINNIIQLLGQ